MLTRMGWSPRLSTGSQAIGIHTQRVGTSSGRRLRVHSANTAHESYDQSRLCVQWPGNARLIQEDLPQLKHIESVDVIWRNKDAQSTRLNMHTESAQILACRESRARRLHSPNTTQWAFIAQQKVRFITGDDTAVFLRSVASKVFNLNPQKTANRYILNSTPHTLYARVRTANLLHRRVCPIHT